MRFTERFVTVALGVLICGCGSGGSNGPRLMLIPGNWQVSAVSTVNPSAGGIAGGASLTQTGATVSGIMHLVSLGCFHIIEDIDLSGSVTGSTLNVASNAVNGQTISVIATGSDKSLAGTYTLSGAPCGPADQGTITATLVPPATGTWHGTLTSMSGPVTQVTATLTQSGPDAHGFFSVSGDVTFSGGTCLPSGPVSSSLVTGAVYTLDMQITNPGVLDVVIAGSMTDPATATAFSGIYRAIGSACTDNGTVSLTKS